MSSSHLDTAISPTTGTVDHDLSRASRALDAVPGTDDSGALGLGVLTAVEQAISTLNTTMSLAELLEQTLRSTRQILPAADHVSVSIARGQQIDTVAATGPLVRDLDAVQYALGEGPCVDAMTGQGLAITADLESDSRWPRYTPVALRRGIVAQLGLQLRYDSATVGGINLYASRRDAFSDPTALTAAAWYAMYAAQALARTLKEEQLAEALATRKTIGQAVGIVMERYSLDEEMAFRYLTRLSQTSNIKLRQVAADLVASANSSAEQSPSTPQPGNSPRSRRS